MSIHDEEDELAMSEHIIEPFTFKHKTDLKVVDTPARVPSFKQSHRDNAVVTTDLAAACIQKKHSSRSISTTRGMSLNAEGLKKLNKMQVGPRDQHTIELPEGHQNQISLKKERVSVGGMEFAAATPSVGLKNDHAKGSIFKRSLLE